MEGIDLFVKILVFVKVLSQWRRRRKEGGRKKFRSLEVREANQEKKMTISLKLSLLTVALHHECIHRMY